MPTDEDFRPINFGKNATNPEPTDATVTKIEAQNIANAAAGLPPVSTDYVKPSPVPEDDLSPLYPKMSEIVAAINTGDPIPSHDDSVVSIEKPYRTDLDAGAASLRHTLDVLAETDKEDVQVEENVPAEVSSQWGSISGGTFSAASVGNVLADQPEFAALQTRTNILTIGFIVEAVMLIVVLIMLSGH